MQLLNIRHTGLVLLCGLAVAPIFSQARFQWFNDDALMRMPHTAMDLTESNWDDTFRALFRNNTPCMVEFYASWCPHCRHYAAVYESAARYFKVASQQGHANLFVGRVDCAANIRTCGAFTKLLYFPAVGIASAFEFLNLNDKNITWHHRLRAPQIVEKVGRYIGKPLVFVDVPAPPAPPGASFSHLLVESGPPQLPAWTMLDVESATRMLWYTIISTPRLHKGAEKRTALLNMMRWWAVAHPSSRCQSGISKIVQQYDTLWPPKQDEPSKEMKQMLVCEGAGPWLRDTPSSWVACGSVIPGLRGFTCGLWLLFHTASVRLPNPTPTLPNPAQLMVSSLRAFAQHFFMCEECAKHFTQIVNQTALDVLTSREDAALWLWRTHNVVNARLADQEDVQGHSYGGDPNYHKIQWPSHKDCEPCTIIRYYPSPPPSPPQNDLKLFLKLGTVLFGSGKETDSKGLSKQSHNSNLPSLLATYSTEWDEREVYLYLNRTYMVEPPPMPPPPPYVINPPVNKTTTTTTTTTTDNKITGLTFSADSGTDSETGSLLSPGIQMNLYLYPSIALIAACLLLYCALRARGGHGGKHGLAPYSSGDLNSDGKGGIALNGAGGLTSVGRRGGHSSGNGAAFNASPPRRKPTL